jgi:hypothetical protein
VRTLRHQLRRIARGHQLALRARLARTLTCDQLVQRRAMCRHRSWLQLAAQQPSRRFERRQGLRPPCSDGRCARVCQSTTARRSGGTAGGRACPCCSGGIANVWRNFCCSGNPRSGRLYHMPGTEARRVDSGRRSGQSAT